MAKRKSYIYKKKKQPVYGLFTNLMKIFLHKPKFTNLNDEFPTDGLMVGPHMGKWGPFYMSQWMPFKYAVIGAHPMLGSYKDRWKYLRDVLYMQKAHKGQVFSSIKATFEAVFSKRNRMFVGFSRRNPKRFLWSLLLLLLFLHWQQILQVKQDMIS